MYIIRIYENDVQINMYKIENIQYSLLGAKIIHAIDRNPNRKVIIEYEARIPDAGTEV